MEKLEGVADAIEWVTEFEKPERVAFPPDHVRPSPARPAPDLLPLILLELEHIKDAVRLNPIGAPAIHVLWREEMKRLGHWDERYEG